MHGNDTQPTMVMISRLVRSNILFIAHYFIDDMAVFKSLTLESECLVSSFSSPTSCDLGQGS